MHVAHGGTDCDWSRGSDVDLDQLIVVRLLGMTFLEAQLRMGQDDSERFFAARRARGETSLRWFGFHKPKGWVGAPYKSVASGCEAVISRIIRYERQLPNDEPREPFDVDAIATESIEKGLTRMATPLNAVIAMPRRRDVCSFAGCGAAGPTNTCARCADAVYCSATCQRAHWAAGHKGECRTPQPLVSRPDLDAPILNPSLRAVIDVTSASHAANRPRADGRLGAFVAPDLEPFSVEQLRFYTTGRDGRAPAGDRPALVELALRQMHAEHERLRAIG
jgi:hypothetical protein